MLAFWVQTQTGTVESWTPRKERTCATLCSSPDPPALARRLQSTPVRRSWASRYAAGKKRDCDARWNGCRSFLTSLRSPVGVRGERFLSAERSSHPVPAEGSDTITPGGQSGCPQTLLLQQLRQQQHRRSQAWILAQ